MTDKTEMIRRTLFEQLWKQVRVWKHNHEFVSSLPKITCALGKDFTFILSDYDYGGSVKRSYLDISPYVSGDTRGYLLGFRTESPGWYFVSARDLPYVVFLYRTLRRWSKWRGRLQVHPTLPAPPPAGFDWASPTMLVYRDNVWQGVTPPEVVPPAPPLPLPDPLAELAAIKEDITYVVTQEFDDVCWLDGYTRLAKYVGIAFDPKVMDEQSFVDHNCRAFHRSLVTGCKYVAPAVVIDDREELVKAIYWALGCVDTVWRSDSSCTPDLMSVRRILHTFAKTLRG